LFQLRGVLGVLGGRHEVVGQRVRQRVDGEHAGALGGGLAAKMERTAAAERLLVSTTFGGAASRTALRWSPWPGSVGPYSGMATWQAYWAPRKPKRYSGLLPMSRATRSPGSPTCCRRAATALMRRLTSARV